MSTHLTRDQSDFPWCFEKADEILPGTGEPDADTAKRLAELYERYSLEMRPESVPELVERHDLDD